MKKLNRKSLRRLIESILRESIDRRHVNKTKSHNNALDDFDNDGMTDHSSQRQPYPQDLSRLEMLKQERSSIMWSLSHGMGTPDPYLLSQLNKIDEEIHQLEMGSV